MSVSAALITASHHSAQQYATPKGQTTGTKAREGDVREQYYGLRAQERPLPGMRPAPLSEVLPQVGVQRHTVEQRIVHTPYVQILDALVPQMPKIPQDIIPQRSVDLVTQMVEQLVEVPTLLSVAVLQQRTAEQLASIPVPRGRVQGFFSHYRVQQRFLLPANAFLSGLWSRSSTFLLLVWALDRGLPHLLVLKMRIF